MMGRQTGDQSQFFICSTSKGACQRAIFCVSDIHAYVMVMQNINRELCRRLRRADNRIAELTHALTRVDHADEPTSRGSG
jgi:hypothetical protein